MLDRHELTLDFYIFYYVVYFHGTGFRFRSPIYAVHLERAERIVLLHRYRERDAAVRLASDEAVTSPPVLPTTVT